jgi:hypothetical protein
MKGQEAQFAWRLSIGRLKHFCRQRMGWDGASAVQAAAFDLIGPSSAPQIWRRGFTAQQAAPWRVAKPLVLLPDLSK